MGLLVVVLVSLLAAPTAADMVADAQNAVSETLFDPGSAQWRDLRVAKPGKVLVVCGEVLAKNRFGGYTGWQQFTWNPAAGLLTRKDMESVGAGVLWPDFYARCR